MINSFHNIAPNNLKRSECTHTHGKLFKDTKSTACFGLGDLNITKQTTLLHRLMSNLYTSNSI